MLVVFFFASGEKERVGERACMLCGADRDHVRIYSRSIWADLVGNGFMHANQFESKVKSMKSKCTITCK